MAPFAWVSLAVWLAGGLAGFYYLYRHGHPSPVWLLGSLILGPFSLLVFMDRAETSSHVIVRQDATSPGCITLVVGMDGSAASGHALEVAQRLVDSQDCSLVLCEIVDYDTEVEPSGRGVAEATRRLEAVAASLGGGNVAIEVMAGRPAHALAQAADKHDADLIVVGARGQGLSKRLLGSVSEDLLRISQRPVLVTHNQAS